MSPPPPAGAGFFSLISVAKTSVVKINEAVKPRFKLVFMIDNFGELPLQERAHLIENERQNIEKSNETLRLENERKRQQIEQLGVLVAQKRALLERMRQAVEELDEEDARIERDVERVMARAA